MLSRPLNIPHLQRRVAWQIDNVIQSHYDEETAPKYINRAIFLKIANLN